MKESTEAVINRMRGDDNGGLGVDFLLQERLERAERYFDQCGINELPIATIGSILTLHDFVGSLAIDGADDAVARLIEETAEAPVEVELPWKKGIRIRALFGGGPDEYREGIYLGPGRNGSIRVKLDDDDKAYREVNPEQTYMQDEIAEPTHG